MSGLRPLPRLRWWLAVGRCALVATVVICLLPLPAGVVPIAGGDKIEHAIGWLLITFWYAQLTATRRALCLRAGGFLLLGAAIEVLQSLTWWRSGDAWDLVANLGGITLGLALGSTPLRGLLALYDQKARAGRA